ncbi:MAG: polyprenyl synthetase family protein [Candidatus Thorarchaeota archaeon]|nr:polyprenyl synthetase family protein [Candidatus Thorarchaeota archaeon]
MSNFEETMKAELNTVNQALAEYMDLKVKQGQQLGLIHEHYYRSVTEYLTRGGKRLRPLLVVTGYKAVSEQVKLKHLYRASCALELLHNGSLLHDDLIDHDETRRGGPTMHALYREWYKKNRRSDEERARDFGAAMAILGGDILLNMGCQIITDSNLDPETATACFKYYQDAYQQLADGVMLEMVMIQDPNASPDMYLTMVRLKTAVLFEKSLLMGATMARASASQLSALGTFGVKVGQAFQMQDDILGSFGDERVTGKSADGDIREGKKTMLVIQAYALGSEAHRKTLESLLGKQNMTADEVATVRKVFKESGALDAATRIMKQLLAEGKAALDSAKPPLNPKGKQFLVDLADFLIERAY